MEKPKGLKDNGGAGKTLKTTLVGWLSLITNKCVSGLTEIDLSKAVKSAELKPADLALSVLTELTPRLSLYVVLMFRVDDVKLDVLLTGLDKLGPKLL